MNEKTFSCNYIFITAALLLGVLYLVAGFIPIDTLWGFNHLKYLPPYSIFVYTALFILATIPTVSKTIHSISLSVVKKFKQLPKIARALFFAAAAAIIFYLLRVHIHALGDGYQRIFQIEKGYLYYHSEPLDFLLHGFVFRLLKIFGIVSGEISYISLSILCGTFFTAMVCTFKLPQQLKENSGLIKILTLTFGGSLLFFGYVESYTFYYIFGLLYLLYATKFVLSGKGIFPASVYFLLAISSHLTAILFLPSFIYLLYHGYRNSILTGFKSKYLPAIIGAIPVIGIIVQEIWLRTSMPGYVPMASGGILPLFSQDGYSIFSPAHLYDILNQLLLIIPVSSLFIGAALLRGIKKEKSGIKTFAIISIISFLLMIFLLDPKIGYARDWDLFAAVTSSLGLVIIIGLIAGFNLKLTDYSKTLAGMMAIILFSSWIITNASTVRQLKRSEDLLYLSDRGRGYSTELLAHYYRNIIGDGKKALELLMAIPAASKNARVWNKIAKTQMDVGQFREALHSIYKGLELDSDFADLHAMAGVLLTRSGEPQKALPHMRKACLLEPERDNYFFALGGVYYRLDSLPASTRAFQRAIEINPRNSPAYFEVANMLLLRTRYDSALVYVQRGLRLEPDYPNGSQLYDLIRQGLRESWGQ